MDKRRNTMVCPHNEGCACTEAQRQCWKCGWHPEVAQRRLDNATAPTAVQICEKGKTMEIKKCGDCIHADVCEEADTLVGFNRENPAYCGMFLDNADVVELPKGKPGDCLVWDTGVGIKQVYTIDSIMVCEDCMRYELAKFAPVVNHPNIVGIISREEAEKERHERCARERTQEEPTLTATEIDFDYEAEDGR